VLFAEGEFAQEDGSRDEYTIGTGGLVLDRDTYIDVDQARATVGTRVSLARYMSATLQARHTTRDTDFSHRESLLAFEEHEGYSAFIDGLRQDRNELQARLNFRLVPGVTVAANYTRRHNEWTATTQPAQQFGLDISSGGSIDSGDFEQDEAGLSISWQPMPRLLLSGTLIHTDAEIRTIEEVTNRVAPYSGDTWTAIVHATWRQTEQTSWTCGWTMSSADFTADATIGPARDVDYDWHRLYVGWRRQLNGNWGIGVDYRFSDFEQPALGGVADFESHAVFLTLSWRD
jgi:hypothetical protein